MVIRKYVPEGVSCKRRVGDTPLQTKGCTHTVFIHFRKWGGIMHASIFISNNIINLRLPPAFLLSTVSNWKKHLHGDIHGLLCEALWLFPSSYHALCEVQGHIPYVSICLLNSPIHLKMAFPHSTSLFCLLRGQNVCLKGKDLALHSSGNNYWKDVMPARVLPLIQLYAISKVFRSLYHRNLNLFLFCFKSQERGIHFCNCTCII